MDKRIRATQKAVAASVCPVIFHSQNDDVQCGQQNSLVASPHTQTAHIAAELSLPPLLPFLLLPHLTAIMLSPVLTIAILVAGAIAHGDHADQMPIAGPHKSLWYNTLPGDGGTQVCQLAEIMSFIGCGS